MGIGLLRPHIRLFSLSCLLLLLTGVLSAPVAGQTPPAVSVYLPVVSERVAVGSGVFGVEVSQTLAESDLDQLVDLGATWIRHNGLSWAAAQPVEGEAYRWDAPEIVRLEQQILAVNQLGSRLVLVVHGSPLWAVAPYTANCAPINPEKYQAFAAFLSAAVERYSQPPFNVRYWEIGNEPDAFIFANDSVFGCWGVVEDAYYGGRAYGDMLNAVYPSIKAANPEAQVLFGGLLLDQPYNPETEAGHSSRFLEGALLEGAGNAFDILAYHSYSFYNGSPDGGMIANWKAPFLRSVLQQYGLDKPLFQSEGALLCLDASTSCQLAQAYAVPRLYARAMRDNLAGFIWYLYDSDSFYRTALVNPAILSEKRPSFLALRHARQMLQGAAYSTTFANLPPEAEGYLFSNGQQVTGVFWSNTPQSFQFALTNPIVNCTEWNGAPFPCASQDGVLTLMLGPGPRYVQWIGQ